MTALLAAMTVAATPPPDLRAAVATEHLVTATEWLVVVGFATLLAAIIAAIAAVRAYQLEAVPGVVIAEHPEGANAALRHAGAYRVFRERGAGAGLQDPVPPPTLRPVREGDFQVLPHLFVEIRNIGRVALADVCIGFEIWTREIDRTAEVISAREVKGTGEVWLSAIAADAAVLLPVAGLSNGCRLDAIGVTAAQLSFAPGRRRRRNVRFAAEPLLFDPGLT